jgi:hypothetical protein
VEMLAAYIKLYLENRPLPEGLPGIFDASKNSSGGIGRRYLRWASFWQH